MTQICALQYQRCAGACGKVRHPEVGPQQDQEEARRRKGGSPTRGHLSSTRAVDRWSLAAMLMGFLIGSGANYGEMLLKLQKRSLKESVRERRQKDRYNQSNRDLHQHIKERREFLCVADACECVLNHVKRSEEHTSELQSLRHLVC